jgi:outer membrane immunogenic protein
MSVTKKIVVAAAMLAAAGAAQAADLPARVAPAPYVAPVPVFTWTGAYFGINAGAAFDNREKFTGNNNVAVLGGNRSFSDSGFSAGGQLGYNYQLGNLGGFGGFGGGGVVIGFETDAMYMDTGKSINTTNPAGTQSFRSGLDYLGTVRGRLGLAFNQFMIYGTGGFAYGDVNSRVVTAFNGVQDSQNASGFNTGYAYGGGIEYALPTSSFLNFFHSSAVTLKAEYLRYSLDSSNLRDNGNASTINLPNYKVKNDGNIARIGLNYKF